MASKKADCRNPYEKSTNSSYSKKVQLQLNKVDFVHYTGAGNIRIDGTVTNGEKTYKIYETIFQKRKGRANPNFKKLETLLEPIGTYEYIDQYGKHKAPKYNPKKIEGIWIRGTAFYGDPIHFSTEPTIVIDKLPQCKKKKK